jgi:hypothetical protein
VVTKQPRSYQKVGDVMAALERCHARAGKICRQSAAQWRGTRTEFVLNALAKQQSNLAEVVTAWRANADANVLNAWIQFVPLEEIEKDLYALQAESLPPAMIADVVTSLQNDMATSVAELRRGSSVAEFSDAFQQLSERESFEIRQTAEVIVQQHDL